MEFNKTSFNGKAQWEGVQCSRTITLFKLITKSLPFSCPENNFKTPGWRFLSGRRSFFLIPFNDSYILIWPCIGHRRFWVTSERHDCLRGHRLILICILFSGFQDCWLWVFNQQGCVPCRRIPFRRSTDPDASAQLDVSDVRCGPRPSGMF